MDISNVIEIISSIRSTKAELNITPKLFCDIIFSEKSKVLKDTVINNHQIIKQVGRINHFSDKNQSKSNLIEILILNEKLSLKFDENVDIMSQKKRILNKIDVLKVKISALNNKLQNKAFVKNAPKEIVQNDRDLLSDLTIEENKLRSIVSSIN